VTPIDPISAVLGIGGKLIDRLWPDPEQRAQAQIALMELAQKGELSELVERASVIKAEAQSEHWLAATWRPVLMLTFGALIVARWLGYSAPNLSPDEVLKLWDIVELGIGGYVIGRSAEKIVPSIADAMRKK